MSDEVPQARSQSVASEQLIETIEPRQQAMAKKEKELASTKKAMSLTNIKPKFLIAYPRFLTDERDSGEVDVESGFVCVKETDIEWDSPKSGSSL